MKTCPCCGYKTLEDNSIYDICEICYWEDDPIQFINPDYIGGANTTSLRQAQKNFIHIGACDKDCLDVVRKITEKDAKDLNWKPLCRISEL
ncbi:CPCC family cysteine-rich protein [Tepidibacter hydrothermalis]|uniref:CPCC family cysteine-rich protein n=1 Tax=Tepidibacter hydrothermalis TaxID=3036126 RepID=A0ABY8EDX3_9FIRM|nr:CPCC family cysteine-rich protein [Tepidibacter hydrothermalis]WFD09784.1 CPCC family cysteine-rich protein [Tepidibacter hydrothermalis]